MFVRDLGERAIKSFVQAFVVTFAGLLAVPADVTDVGAWKAVLVAAAGGAATAGLSALSSVLSRHVGDTQTASLVREPQAHP